MKNIVYAMMVIVGFSTFAYSGECSNGVCFAPLRPVRKVVNVTKEIVVAPARAVVAVVTPNYVTSTNCDCGCSASSRTVTKYQPVRRRLVNRSTTVGCDCGCQ